MTDPTDDFAEHLRQQVLGAYGFDGQAELDAATEEALPGYLAAEAEYHAERDAFEAEMPGRAEAARQAVETFLRDQGILPEGTQLEVTPMDLEADPLWVAPAPWAQPASAAEPSDVLARIDAAIDDWEDGPDAARWFPDMSETDDAVAPTQYVGLLATLDGEYMRPPRCRCSVVPAWLEIPATSVEIEFDTVPAPPLGASMIRQAANFQRHMAVLSRGERSEFAAYRQSSLWSFDEAWERWVGRAPSITFAEAMEKLRIALVTAMANVSKLSRELTREAEYSRAARDYHRRTRHRNRRRKS